MMKRFNAVSLRLLYFICLVDNTHLKFKNNALVVNKGVLSFCMPNTDLLFLSMPNTDLLFLLFFFPFLCLISITTLPKLGDQWSMKAVLGDLQNISSPFGVFAIQIRAGARRQRSSSGFGQHGRQRRWLSGGPAIAHFRGDVHGEMAEMLPQHRCCQPWCHLGVLFLFLFRSSPAASRGTSTQHGDFSPVE